MSQHHGPPESDDLANRLRDLLHQSGLGFQAPRPAATGEPAAADAPAVNAARLERLRGFDLTPRQVHDYLDRFVISQDEAKRVLAVALCDHYHQVRRCLETTEADDVETDIAKHNVLLLGPTGVGKTYLMRCAARLIGVPFVKADATKFSETGYVGYDVEDIVRDLVRIAGQDASLARFGIVYIDEIDKIAGAPQEGGRDVSGRGVQINLLKLMEENEVRLVSQTDMLAQMQAIMALQSQGEAPPRTINTRHMLFIVSGAFDRLPELIRRRLGRTQIGFAKAVGPDAEDRGAWLRQVETRDLVDFGFEPEFVGRLPVRVALDRLSPADLESILGASEGSILKQYRDDFAGYGIDLEVRPDALPEIARRAHAEGTGARGLMTVLEKLLRDFKFELPSSPVRRLVLDAALVHDPAATLQALLSQGADGARASREAEVTAFAEAFAREHGLDIAFTPAASAALVDLAEQAGQGVEAVCRERFKDLAYALSLISRYSSRQRFSLTKALVMQPDAELSRWVTASCGRATPDHADPPA